MGCAHFPENFQNFSERQILWSLCSVVFLALTLKLPIQTSLVVAPELPVSLSSHEKYPNVRKMTTLQANYLGLIFFSLLDIKKFKCLQVARLLLIRCAFMYQQIACQYYSFS